MRCATHIGLLFAVLVGCAKTPPPTPSKTLVFEAAERLWQLELQATAAAAGANGLLAVGDVDGRVAVVAPGGKPQWLRREVCDEKCRAALAKRSSEKAKPTTKTTTDTPATSTPRWRNAHEGPVAALDFSKDGTRLISAGGKRIALWSLSSSKLEHQLVGPQRLTTAAFGPAGRMAYFGTSQGHVLSWGLDGKGAQSVAALSCGARMVNPLRRELPKSDRCPYGKYGQEGGRSYCVYPATHLQRSGARLARACRTGDVTILDLEQNKAVHTVTEGVGALGFIGDDRLLIAERGGALKLYKLGSKQQRRGMGLKAPSAFCSAASLFALAHPRLISVWSLDGKKPIGGVKVPAKALWLRLFVKDNQGELRAVLADGSAMRYPFRLQQQGDS